MKVSYQWLKEYVGDALPPPEAVAELLTFHAFEIDGVETIDGDTVLDVDVLPNRSSDCLCHRGIARELASIMAIPLAHDPLARAVALTPTSAITVTIENPADCPRFSVSLVTGVRVGPSPEWLRNRLAALGQRSVNNIVDATNYIMYAIGQPVHAYDADLFPQVNGVWQFAVRRARIDETISLLPEKGSDDRVVTLQGTELLVVDAASDTPIGLAGVKGGRFASVHEETRNIIIEAAHFDPIVTRRTARRLGIVIDASKRFENEPARDLPPYAQHELITLITAIAGGTYEGACDVYPAPSTPPTVVVPLAQVNAHLGLSLSAEAVHALIARIGATVVMDANQPEHFTVTAPWERTDLRIAEDYIEEVGRLYGLGNIEAVEPATVPLAEYNARYAYTEIVRETLVTLGFSEVITSSFVKQSPLKLERALASDKSCMRTVLHDNLLQALGQNVGRMDVLGLDAVLLFEIGTVFTKTETGIAEHTALAFGVRHKAGAASKADQKRLTEAIAALETALKTTLPTQAVEGIIEVNLSVVLATLPPLTSYPPAPPVPTTSYTPFSPYPAVTRDIALWVKDETAAAVESLLETTAGPLCLHLRLFDEFTKDDRTSYAFRLVFQSFERTLTDVEVNERMELIYKAVAKRGWEVR